MAEHLTSTQGRGEVRGGDGEADKRGLQWTVLCSASVARGGLASPATRGCWTVERVEGGPLGTVWGEGRQNGDDQHVAAPSGVALPAVTT